MSVNFWTGGRFKKEHERLAQEEAVRLLAGRFSTGPPLHAVFNVYCNGAQFDLLVLKPDALIVVDFKHCDKPIEAFENRPWQILSGGNLKGAHYDNPFEQISDYRNRLINFIAANKEKCFTLQKARFLDFEKKTKLRTGFKGIVAVHPRLQLHSQNISERHRWFRLVGLDQLPSAIDIFTNDELLFDDEELLSIIQHKELLGAAPLTGAR